MIKFITDLYRGMIGFGFVIGAVLAVAALLLDLGGRGAMAALLILAITLSVTGVSAVLISINDHLAALRDK